VKRARQLLLGAVVVAWAVLSVIVWWSPDEWTILAEIFPTLYALVAAAVVWALFALARRLTGRDT
jgi:sarcosine oxidase gamma subunit